jgi:hypothetical protein
MPRILVRIYVINYSFKKSYFGVILALHIFPPLLPWLALGLKFVSHTVVKKLEPELVSTSSSKV